MAKPIQLLAIDLDGTLVNREGNISSRNLRALHKICALGVEFVPVSARPGFGIEHALGAFNCYRYMIAFNGAYLIDRDENQVLLDLRMDADSVGRILELVKEHHLYAGYYLGDEFYAETNGDGADLEAAFQGRRQTFVADLQAIAPRGANKIIVLELHDLKRLNAFYEQAVRAVPGVNMIHSSERSVEISHKQASKGSGLRLLAERLDIPSEFIAAIGDNFNDISMIQFAGTGIAIGDAPKEVKQHADLVVGTCEADGAAEAIERILLPKAQRSTEG